MTAGIAFSDEGTGPAVLLVHGQPGSAADWHGVRRALREHCRVIVPDRPGYGRTGGQARGIRENAQALLELVADLDAAPVTLVGHSWGSAVALAAAGSDAVGALVLVNPVAPWEELRGLDRALADRRLGPPLTRGMFKLAGGLGSVRPVRWALRGALPGFDPAQWRPAARAWRGEEEWRTFVSEQHALLRELPLLRHDVAAHRAATVVLGRRDRITDPRAGNALAHALGAHVVEVPNGGHLIPQRSPRVAARAIIETVERAA